MNNAVCPSTSCGDGCWGDVFQEIDMAGEVMVHHQMRSCVSSHHLYFVGTLYAIHTLVLLLGIFLAYETRKVRHMAVVIVVTDSQCLVAAQHYLRTIVNTIPTELLLLLLFYFN